MSAATDLLDAAAKLDLQIAIAKRVRSEIEAVAGDDEAFIGETIHGIVMVWIDERVIAEDDPDLAAVTYHLAQLAAKQRFGLEQLEKGARPLSETRDGPRKVPT